MSKVTAIILAGGTGSRMGTKVKKQYIQLKGKEVIAHTIEVFNQLQEIDEIIVVTGKEEIIYMKEDICRKYNFDKVIRVVEGGKERQDSVSNGINAIEHACDYIIIHDGARPFIKAKTIRECLAKTKEIGASIVGVPVKDTIKVYNPETGMIENTPNRSTLWAIQTPQIFKTEIIKEAHSYAKKNKVYGTDDSSLVEAMGRSVHMVMGEYTNIKLTTPEDLLLGERILEDQMDK
ncbi:MAG: 2-C-methyl-D-erythritol 4-phosphate cytidylyltransferase [Cellulosilyticaceae bacterium]